MSVSYHFCATSRNRSDTSKQNLARRQGLEYDVKHKHIMVTLRLCVVHGALNVTQRYQKIVQQLSSALSSFRCRGMRPSFLPHRCFPGSQKAKSSACRECSPDAESTCWRYVCEDALEWWVHQAQWFSSRSLLELGCARLDTYQCRIESRQNARAPHADECGDYTIHPEGRPLYNRQL